MNEMEEKLYGKDPRKRLKGDVPGDTDMGVVEINLEHDVNNEAGVEEFTKNNPDLQKFAEDSGRDLVALIKGRKAKIFIGAGIASAGIIGGIILYNHKQKDKE